MNQTGRVFSTYPEDIPALYKSCDGQIFDLYKDNDTFILPAEKIASAVNIVPALEILAKEPYLFFGNEIHVSNIEAEYTRLKAELEIYKNSKTLHLPGNFPKIPGISAKKAQPSLPQSDTVMLELADIKQKYQNGSISEEEYQTAIQKIMLKL